MTGIECLPIEPAIRKVVSIEALKIFPTLHIEASAVGHPILDVVVIRGWSVIHGDTVATLVVNDRPTSLGRSHDKTDETDR